MPERKRLHGYTIRAVSFVLGPCVKCEAAERKTLFLAKIEKCADFTDLVRVYPLLFESNYACDTQERKNVRC